MGEISISKALVILVVTKFPVQSTKKIIEIFSNSLTILSFDLLQGKLVG